MAIFASTTTSGYSDPMKALSIKALEQRQKDMLAMKGDVISPENTQTPVQGIGHVLNQLGDSMAQGRVMQAAAAQREMLAQTIAHMDPNNPKPEELARISTADPELMKQMLLQLAESRRQQVGFEHADKSQQAGFTHDTEVKQGEYAHQDKSQQAGFTHADTSQQAGFTHADAAAKAKAETDELARQAQAEETRIAAEREIEAKKDAAAKAADLTRETHAPELVQMTEALRKGKIDQETFDAWKAKQTAVPASEMKAGNDLQDKYLSTQGAIGDLKTARGLMGPDGTGIRAGAGGGGTQTIAKWGGDALGLSDPKLTQNTERYNQIMTSESITAMAERLKGATTNEEMARFISIMNDPNAEPKTKMQALDNMIAKAEAHALLQKDQLTRARLPVPEGPAGPATADPMEGKTATGPDGQKIIRRNGKWEPVK